MVTIQSTVNNKLVKQLQVCSITKSEKHWVTSDNSSFPKHNRTIKSGLCRQNMNLQAILYNVYQALPCNIFLALILTFLRMPLPRNILLLKISSSVYIINTITSGTTVIGNHVLSTKDYTHWQNIWKCHLQILISNNR